MPNINVFSLADVLQKNQALSDARQMQEARAQNMQLQQMQMDKIQRDQAQQISLDEIVGQGFVTKPQTTVPDISPEAYQAGQMGPAGPDRVIPGSTRFDFQKAYEAADRLPPGQIKAQALLLIQKQQQDQEDRRLKMMSQLDKTQESGMFSNYNPKVQEGASGRSDPLNVRGYLTQKLGREPSPEEIKADYIDQMKYMYSPTVINYGSPEGDRTKLAARGQAAGIDVPKPYEAEVEKLSNKIDKNKILNVVNPINTIDRMNEKYKNRPEGIGYLRNMKVGNWLNTSEGNSYRAAVENLISAQIYDDSGAAISIPEEDRTRMRSMLSAAKSAEDYVRIYNEQIRPRWELAARNSLSAPSHVVDAWQNRTGIDLRGWVNKKTTSGNIIGPVGGGQSPPRTGGKFNLEDF